MLIKVTHFLKQPNVELKHLPDRGFTIVESLMAMVLISIVIVAMTPPILLAVGSRVQNRRAEQAMQLAQGEIDRIKVLVEQGNYTEFQLPYEVPSATLATVKNEPAPTSIKSSLNYIKSSQSCTGTIPYNGQEPIASNQVLRVNIYNDKNNKCKTDFLVQTFREPGLPIPTPTTPNPPPTIFHMGVRVYAGVAEQNMGKLEIKRAPLKFTTGQGSQRSHPLAVIYTTISRSDLTPSLTRYNQHISPP